MAQLEHDQVQSDSPPLQFTLVCCGVISPANAGGMFRLADAAGVEEVIFCPPIPNLRSDRMKRTSRDTHKWIPHRICEEPEKLIDQYKADGRKIIALEITDSSLPVDELSLIRGSRPVLLVGGERHGVPEYLLDKTDIIGHIPIFGRNSSMNVVQATAIALFTIIQGVG